ncbi:hypothetical protein E3Q08_03599 [Wallemia mellicola]|nr:hypothetical protein E3Q08_03599 [Wallemia mellicola]
MNPYSKENDMEIDHNKNTELQAKALEVYRQKESELSEILLGSITEDVFNPANIDSSTPHSQNVPKHLKLRYGDNARDFYRDLQVIFNKLRKADPTIGEQGLRHQAVQALPLELEQVKYEVYDQTETEYNYDNQDKGVPTLDQSGYIAKAITDLNLQNTKRKSIPMSTNLTLSNEDSPSSEDHSDEMKTKPYAQAIGKLNWIAQASRPDIAFATKFRREKQSLDGYCKGVILRKDIKGHVDADYAGCWDMAKSTNGCVFTYSGGAIAWTSKRQKCVATSTGEAEYMAIKHGSDIANLAKKRHEAPRKRTQITNNNQNRQYCCPNKYYQPWIYHGPQTHKSKERHERKEIEVKGIRTHDQLADIFTKALNENQLRSLCKGMGINTSDNNTVKYAIPTNDPQYKQQEECQNNDTGLNIQHHLTTRDRRNKKLHQAREEHCDAVRSRGQQGTCGQ